MKVIFKGSQYLYLTNGYLTINKVYTVEEKKDLEQTQSYIRYVSNMYYIKCDNDKYQMINKKYFITLDEHRDNIINQLTNESNI